MASEKAIEDAANVLAHKMGYCGVGHANQFRDWIAPILDAAAAVDGDAQKSAWLIEWPASDNMPARWWHPKDGWMLDANKAVRFSRKEDAEAYKREMRIGEHLMATEHIWCDPVDGDAQWNAAIEAASELTERWADNEASVEPMEHLSPDRIACARSLAAAIRSLKRG